MTIDTSLLFFRLVYEENSKLWEKKTNFNKVRTAKSSYEEQSESNQHLSFLQFSVN